ncbi:Protein of unknown function [Gryllus bimaculatus]|nr:Protein of unknown function [Gryllus bimaculatus]
MRLSREKKKNRAESRKERKRKKRKKKKKRPRGGGGATTSGGLYARAHDPSAGAATQLPTFKLGFVGDKPLAAVFVTDEMVNALRLALKQRFSIGAVSPK